MDFFSLQEKDAREQGIYLKPAPPFLKKLNQKMRKKALPIIQLEEKAPGSFSPALLSEINQACHQMVKWVYEELKTIHKEGKKIGLIGGDHSVSEGALLYWSEVTKGDFGVLCIDAHADLRKSYQGFHHSHASVMRNVMVKPLCPSVLVQVGVRDFSKEEYQFIKARKNIHTFFDEDLKKALFEGKTWCSLVDSLLKVLPEKVYITLDVDGLSPPLFPETGTPVPGGLSFEEVCYLLKKLSQNHQIIGFDLVEVARPKGSKDSLSGQNGAHLLYKLCELI